jgi:predicted LPLAT superfamily acyltransferase
VSAHWKARPEGGGAFAIRLIRGIGLRGGRPLARACLYPITLYFLLRRGPERRASRAYLTRALGRPATLADVARHIHCFAATILDRLFLLGDRRGGRTPGHRAGDGRAQDRSGDVRSDEARFDDGRFDIRVSGLDALHAAIDRGRGLLLFGSHLGSFEVLRVLKRARPEVPLRVVLDRGHNPALTRLLEELDPELAASVIDAGQDGPAIMLAIQQAVAAGAMVALLVDRVHPGGGAVRVPFLGREAPWPLAPWQIAAVLQVPVLLAFGLYRGGNRYQLAFEPFAPEGVRLARGERARAIPALIAGYVARLEDRVRAAPYNWFNFYDFWDADDARQASPLDDAGAGAGPRPAAGPAPGTVAAGRRVGAGAALPGG